MSLAATAPVTAQDAEKGNIVFNQCRACHQVGPQARSMLAPTLNGLFGRRAGTAPRFMYTKAMTESGVIWDEKTFRNYIRNPRGKIPGTAMIFPGIQDEQDIDDLIAYLREFTHLKPAGLAEEPNTADAGRLSKEQESRAREEQWAIELPPEDASEHGPYLVTAAAKRRDDARRIDIAALWDSAKTVRIESTSFVIDYQLVPADIKLNNVFVVLFKVSPKGRAVAQDVRINAVMPDHNHGMNTRVDIAVADGLYVADGMLFHMLGEWELRFTVSAGGAKYEVLSKTITLE